MKDTTKTWLITTVIIWFFQIISFFGTASLYYLFTLVMNIFFNIEVPFSWQYAVGIWLIVWILKTLFGGLDNQLFKTKT